MMQRLCASLLPPRRPKTQKFIEAFLRGWVQVIHDGNPVAVFPLHFIRGWLIYRDDDDRRFLESGALVVDEQKLSCSHCGIPPILGADPCIGKLPGVISACCGHGDTRDAYVLFENGVRLEGFAASCNVLVSREQP